MNARSAVNHTQIQLSESGQFPKSGAAFFVYTGCLGNDCPYLPCPAHTHGYVELLSDHRSIIYRGSFHPQMLLKPLLVTTERPKSISSKCVCKCGSSLKFPRLLHIQVQGRLQLPQGRRVRILARIVAMWMWRNWVPGYQKLTLVGSTERGTEDSDTTSLRDWVLVMLLTNIELPTPQQVCGEVIISIGDILSCRGGL